MSVRLTDPELIGRLITEATEKLAAEIDGPHWQIAANNPVWLEAAKQASADGRRKAQAYAEGVDARLGRLIRLIEPGVGHVSSARVAGAPMAAAAEPMPIERGEHEVGASVNATFALDLD